MPLPFSKINLVIIFYIQNIWEMFAKCVFIWLKKHWKQIPILLLVLHILWIAYKTLKDKTYTNIWYFSWIVRNFAKKFVSLLFSNKKLFESIDQNKWLYFWVWVMKKSYNICFLQTKHCLSYFFRIAPEQQFRVFSCTFQIPIPNN